MKKRKMRVSMIAGIGKLRLFLGAAAMMSLALTPAVAAGVNDVDVDVKGCVKDQKSKEPLIGATVHVVGSDIAAVSDVDGNFQLTGLSDGIYDIEIKYVGYKTAVKRQVKIEDNKVMTLDFEMVEDDHQLSDVVVVA